MTGRADSETRRFVANSAMYLLPTLLLRGLSFLLTPVYSRAMSVADFGVVGIATTLVTLLGIVLGFALFSSVGRLYVDCETEAQKRRFLGTIATALLVVPPGLTLLLEVAGSAGWLTPLSSLRWPTELRVVIWAALFSVYPSLGAAVLTIREEPRRLAVLNVGTAAAQIAATLVLVVMLRLGAVGVLWSTLIGNIAGTLGTFVMLAPIEWRLDRVILRRALTYSLPLLPHLLSNWAFAVSDRLILERYVDKAAIGEYSLAYMFSFAVSVVTGATISAFAPIAQKTFKASNDVTPDLRRVSTIVVGVLTFSALGAALLGVDAIRLFTPSSYHGATRWVGLVVLGAFAQGLALVVAQVTWFVERTGRVASITMVASGLNIGLNLLLIPRYGVVVAAASTAGCGLVLLGLHAVVARLLLPVRWPYSSWLVVLGLAFAAIGLDALIGDRTVEVTLVSHVLIVFVGFPAGLVACGLLRVQDLRDLLGRRVKA